MKASTIVQRCDEIEQYAREKIEIMKHGANILI